MANVEELAAIATSSTDTAQSSARSRRDLKATEATGPVTEAEISRTSSEMLTCDGCCGRVERDL